MELENRPRLCVNARQPLTKQNASRDDFEPAQRIRTKRLDTNEYFLLLFLSGDRGPDVDWLPLRASVKIA